MASPRTRSGFKLAKPPRRKEGDVAKPALPEKPTTGAHFNPYTLHDVAFTSLRLMVFKEDPRSATPIAHLLRERLSDADVYALINSAAVAKRTNPVQVDVFVFDEEIDDLDDQPPGPSKLRLEMDKARELHGVRLRDARMVDVDILYSAEAAVVSVFKDDMEVIRASGGSLYHLWPYNEATQTVGMSAIVKPEVLDKLYPPDRVARGGITITHNTEQASSDTQPPPEPKNSIFPYMKSIDLSDSLYSSSTNDDNDGPKDDVEGQKDTISNDVDRILGSEARRSRGYSIEAVNQAQKAEKMPWNTFASGRRATQPQPEWSPDSGPFATRDVVDDDTWWVEDHKTRTKQIGDWDRATWKERTADGKGHWGRQLSEAPAHLAKPGVDYQVVQEMSSTYVPDRSYEWHEENIAKPGAQETKMALAQAEQQYKNKLQLARYSELQLQHGQKAFLRQRAEQPASKPNLALQDQVREMQVRQMGIDAEMERKRQRIMQLRMASGYSGKAIGAALFDDEENEKDGEDAQPRGKQPPPTNKGIQPSSAKPVARPSGARQTQMKGVISRAPQQQAAESLAGSTKSVPDSGSIADRLWEGTTSTEGKGKGKGEMSAARKAEGRRKELLGAAMAQMRLSSDSPASASEPITPPPMTQGRRNVLNLFKGMKD